MSFSLPLTNVLLNMGADPNARDVFGYTPLHYATLHGYDKVWGIVTSPSTKLPHIPFLCPLPPLRSSTSC